MKAFLLNLNAEFCQEEVCCIRNVAWRLINVLPLIFSKMRVARTVRGIVGINIFPSCGLLLIRSSIRHELSEVCSDWLRIHDTGRFRSYEMLVMRLAWPAFLMFFVMVVGIMMIVLVLAAFVIMVSIALGNCCR